jgi:hypothetical protein
MAQNGIYGSKYAVEMNLEHKSYKKYVTQNISQVYPSILPINSKIHTIYYSEI